MKSFGKLLSGAAIAASLAVGGMMAASSPASAHVVCNRAGDCWSTHARYNYPSELGVRYYSDRYSRDNYRARRWGGMNRTWRDEHHERDRGYYRDGLWVTF